MRQPGSQNVYIFLNPAALPTIPCHVINASFTNHNRVDNNEVVVHSFLFSFFSYSLLSMYLYVLTYDSGNSLCLALNLLASCSASLRFLTWYILLTRKINGLRLAKNADAQQDKHTFPEHLISLPLYLFYSFSAYCI